MSRQIRYGFNGGEISDEVWSRLDLGKYPMGVSLAENFWILPHGPAQNRPGLVFINQAKASTARLLEFNAAQVGGTNFILEVGPAYIRVHSMAGTLVRPSVAITGVTNSINARVTAPGHDFADGDWVYIDIEDSGDMERWLEGRFVVITESIAGDSFVMQDLRGTVIDSSAWLAWNNNGTASKVFEIVTPYQEADLFKLQIVQKHDVMTITHPSYEPRELRRVSAYDWQLSTISFVPALDTPAAPTVTAIKTSTETGAPVTHFYKTTALAANSLEESLPSPSGSASNDLSLAGNRNDITPAAVTGAVRYNVYKLRNGLYGFLAQTEGGVVSDTNIAPDMSKTLPIASNPFSGAGNFPAVVTYYEGRRVFAGTNNLPQNFWLTVSGTEKNLNYSIPTRDDDSIAGALGSNQVHAIRAAVGLTNLIFLTNGGEWKLSGGQDVLTPANALPKQDGSEGCGTLRPVVSTGTVVYANESETRLNKLEFSWEKSAYVVEDLSVLAPHLFDTYTLVDISYLKSPWKMIWAARSDGMLLGLTYHPEHEVAAWHRHTTDGVFKTLASIRDGKRTVLWAGVHRIIQGNTYLYIEYLADRATDPYYGRRAAKFSDSLLESQAFTYQIPEEN